MFQNFGSICHFVKIELHFFKVTANTDFAFFDNLTTQSGQFRCVESSAIVIFEFCWGFMPQKWKTLQKSEKTSCFWRLIDDKPKTKNTVRKSTQNTCVYVFEPTFKVRFDRFFWRFFVTKKIVDQVWSFCKRS